tara:strand:- start:3829 stop:4206 length:378 start_codon:yes stop_codon:yes gene_type:complete
MVLIPITRYSKQNAQIICILYRSIIRKTKERFPETDLSNGIPVNISDQIDSPVRVEIGKHKNLNNVDIVCDYVCSNQQPQLNALGFLKYCILYRNHRDYNLQDLFNVHKTYDEMLDLMEEDFGLK